MAFKIFIIAGEPSGDWLGAKLITELKKLKSEVEISGIGGAKMEAQGLKSLFPMQEISLMGFAEILPHLPNLLKRIKQTTDEIRAFKPDVVVTIDSPGFVFRVAKKIQDLRPATKLVHYVAPTVWAYKPGRAKKVNQLYDKLLCILPFEPQYFTNAEFIGHPVIEDGLDKGDAARFKAKYNLADFICMMPGSRPAELKRNLPVFKKVAENLGKPVVIIAADEAVIDTAGWRVKTVVINNSEKADCFATAAAGVIKSGTAGLEFAFANKPYVVAYKVSWPSYLIIKALVRVKYANILNLLSGKKLVRELLQGECRPSVITAALQYAILQADLSEYQKNLDKLKPASGSPSANAARIILSIAHASPKGFAGQASV